MTELPDHNKKAGRRYDGALNLAALFISCLSIGLAYLSNQSIERVERASAWPFLQLESGNDLGDREEMYFLVRNAGTGPARIHSIGYLFDGSPVTAEFVLDYIAQRCCADARRSMTAAAGDDLLAGYGTIRTAPLAPGFLAASGETVYLSWRKASANEVLWRAIDKARYTKRIGLRVCYCSVFDECWVTETSTFPPKAITSCSK